MGEYIVGLLIMTAATATSGTFGAGKTDREASLCLEACKKRYLSSYRDACPVSDLHD